MSEKVIVEVDEESYHNYLGVTLNEAITNKSLKQFEQALENIVQYAVDNPDDDPEFPKDPKDIKIWFLRQMLATALGLK